MREIKFRAWNGKEVFNVDVMAISPCTWDCPDYGKRGVSLAYQPSIQVMQFTGLKDKNGVEIYEGDILNLFLMDWSGVPLDQFTVSSETFHNDVCYIAEIIKCAENDWVEVIGNIYEHPHLLEVAQ